MASSPVAPTRGELVTVFLGGDVMTGRGVDQILAHPNDPRLRETSVRDARRYVELAEAVSGPIPRPVPWSWIWGDALATLAQLGPDVRVINLETSITRRAEFEPHKQVHYRMNPDNVACLALIRPDACALANNHAGDFGPRGLLDTLNALAGAGLAAVGAGTSAAAARAPLVLPVRGGDRVVVFCCGMADSGVPADWAATADRPGVNFLPDGSAASTAELLERISAARRARDVVVVSIHWGPNWGYHIPGNRTRLAHRLVDAGADIVHGHSAHHPQPIEVYRERLVLYGCGDLVNDYEGIGGYPEYRSDLRLLYFASVAPESGALVSLRMVPVRSRRMRLHRASEAESEWIRATLDHVSAPFGVRVERESAGMLAVRR